MTGRILSGFACKSTPFCNSGQLLNSTDLARVDLQLRVSYNRDGTIVGENQSSLMTRRELVLELGGWDRSKIGADDELHRRLLLKHDVEKNRNTAGRSPVFAQVRDNSLTASANFGVNTNQYGARREYLEAFQHWHRLEAYEGIAGRVEAYLRERPFPIPNVCKSGPPQPVTVYLPPGVGLVNLAGAAQPSISGPAQVGTTERGFECACFHWPRLLKAGAKLNAAHPPGTARQSGPQSVVPRRGQLRRHLVIVSDPVLLPTPAREASQKSGRTVAWC